MVDEGTKKTLALIPLLKTKAGPRDGELWVQRLKEEYQSLIAVIVFRIVRYFVATYVLVRVHVRMYLVDHIVNKPN